MSLPRADILPGTNFRRSIVRSELSKITALLRQTSLGALGGRGELKGTSPCYRKETSRSETRPWLLADAGTRPVSKVRDSGCHEPIFQAEHQRSRKMSETISRAMSILHTATHRRSVYGSFYPRPGSFWGARCPKSKKTRCRSGTDMRTLTG